MPEHVTLQSSALRSASYDATPDKPDVGALTVTFNNGRTYTHDNVPRAMWDRLKNTSSPGKTYLDDIKGAY
jgi:hypothetical protein